LGKKAVNCLANDWNTFPVFFLPEPERKVGFWGEVECPPNEARGEVDAWGEVPYDDSGTPLVLDGIGMLLVSTVIMVEDGVQRDVQGRRA